jgi:hypothetical protein
MSAAGTGISVLPAVTLPLFDDRLIWEHASNKIPMRVDVINDADRSLVPPADYLVDIIGGTSLEVKNKTAGSVDWIVWVYFEVSSTALNLVPASQIQIND